jgi:acyl carrier protein
MRMDKLQEILFRIVESSFGVAVAEHAFLANKLKDTEWGEKLNHALQEELDVSVTPAEIETAASISQLSILLHSRLATDLMGRSLVDVYSILERLITEGLSHDVNYNWYATWMGDLLSESDSLDDVEIVISMEHEFGFSIPDRDAQAMQTVNQTVRYLWRRGCEQDFTLRPRPKTVCQRAFVFYELRRLLVVRGGVSRNSVRLDARLGDLLPTSYRQFWEQVQKIFHANLPQGSRLAFGSKREKNTTMRQLVILIQSSQNRR